MSQQLPSRERVRLKTRDYEPDYYPGDKGTVLSGPHHRPSGGFFYWVRMDKDDPAATGITLFAEELEIEAPTNASG